MRISPEAPDPQPVTVELINQFPQACRLAFTVNGEARVVLEV